MPEGHMQPCAMAVLTRSYSNSGGDQAALLAENRPVSSSAAWSCFAHHCNQGQCCSNQMLAMGSDKLGTYRLTISAKKTFSQSKTNKTWAV